MTVTCLTLALFCILSVPWPSDAGEQDGVGRGPERMQWLRRVGTASSLMPSDLRSLGVKVTVAPYSREFTMRRFYRVLDVPSFFQLERASYQITWGVKANNGMFLVLPFRDSDPCITEGSIKREFGPELQHSRSGDRHLMPNQRLPPGMRPWRDTYEVTLENGFTLGFSFDDACASELALSQGMPPTWIPELAALEM